MSKNYKVFINNYRVYTSVNLAVKLDKLGADILEIGIPYSDPLADGEIIQEFYSEAINLGVRVKNILNIVKKIREESEMPVVIMAYFNILYCYGIDRFLDDIKEAGVDGIIVPDIPLEERKYLKGLAKEREISLIPLVAKTSKDRIKNIVEDSEGFIYAVSKNGTTGGSVHLDSETKEYLNFVKENTTTPVMIGFGIKSGEDVKRVADNVDGVIIGSALLKIAYEDISKIEDFIKKIKKEL